MKAAQTYDEKGNTGILLPRYGEDVFGIGKAVKEMQNGERVARRGWNKKNMHLFLVPGSVGVDSDGAEINYLAHVDMRTADGCIVPWVCSQSDLLAIDWSVFHQNLPAWSTEGQLT